MQIGDATRSEGKIFKIRRDLDRPYEMQDLTHFSVNYELDMNLVEYNREVYSGLAWFGNLGGLSEGLRIFFGFFLAVINYNFYDSYMVSQLFRVKETPEEHELETQKSNI